MSINLNEINCPTKIEITRGELAFALTINFLFEQVRVEVVLYWHIIEVVSIITE